MNLDEMALPDVEERLAALDIEVRSFTDAAAVETATAEKKSLLERRKELRDLESRKQAAIDLNEEKKDPDKIIETRKVEKYMDFADMHATEVRATPEYRSAFYKQLLNRPLNDAEKRAALAVADVPGVIPVASSARIFDLVRQYAPLLNEVTLLRVPGPVKFGVEQTNNVATIHTENAAITPASDAMTYVQLNAYELVKVLRISKTVAAQAISAFEGWLTEYLARSISKLIGNYMLYGSGSSQPKGVDNMNAGAWTDNTNATQWAGASPTTAELLEQVSRLKGGYHNGAVWVTNASTLWGTIAPQQDNSKFSILSPDYTRMLGYRILLDDNCKAGDLFFGNFREGMVANLSEDIMVERSAESGFLANAFDFRGSCIFDCTVTHTEGFVKGAADLTVSSI
jgi:HK97 family phage major capsid protein